MVKTHDDFNFEKIFHDGRKLEIKLTNSSLAEQQICLKLARHTIEAIEQYQRFLLVENFIKESMRKLRCEKNK